MPKPTKAQKQQDLPKASYLVLSRLRHDGEEYAKGETVDLTEPQAKPLIEAKVVEAAKA